MKKIAFIVNGLHKKNKKLKTLLEKIKDKYEISTFTTQATKHAIELTQKAAKEGAEIIVAVGGDGTLNEVANGILTLDTERKPILAVLPCGTGNDFVRTLKPRPLEEAFAEPKTRKIDAFELNFFDRNNEKEKRYSMNVSDLGIGASTIEIIDRNRGNIFGGTATFLWAVIKAFLSFQSTSLCMKADNLEFKGKITTLDIANGKRFAGGLAIAPDAEFDDGIIDVTLVRKIRLTTFLKSFPKLQRGEKLDIKEISYHKTKTLTITSQTNQELPIEGDGELFGFTPLEVKVEPLAIEVLY